MTWVRLDDAFTDHPKVAGLSDGAFRVFVTALCYCNKNLTDGLVPALIARQVASARLLAELVEARMFETDGANYRVHDYDQYQPSKEKVLLQREATKERVGNWRGNKRGNAVTAPVTNAVSNTAPVPVPKDPVSIPPLPPAQLALLERLHAQVRIRIFGGMNAPDSGWCEDLIRRGVTESDIIHAIDAAAQKRGPGAMNYCRAVLLRRVEEREAGNDPDAERVTGTGRSGRDGVSGQTQRGGLRVVGAGRAPRPRVQGFDSSGLPPAIGDDDEDWYRKHPEDRPATS